MIVRTKPQHLPQPLDNIMKGRKLGLSEAATPSSNCLIVPDADRAETNDAPGYTGENCHQLSPRAAETFMAQRGEVFGIRLAGHHGFPSASGHDVPDHRAQFDVRLLQERLDALYAAAQSRTLIASASGQIVPKEQCNAASWAGPRCGNHHSVLGKCQRRSNKDL
jgi:hypothetical protein